MITLPKVKYGIRSEHPHRIECGLAVEVVATVLGMPLARRTSQKSDSASVSSFTIVGALPTSLGPQCKRESLREELGLQIATNLWHGMNELK